MPPPRTPKPTSAAVAKALEDQYALIKAHIYRLRERCERYRGPSLARTLCEVELSFYTEQQVLLDALLHGKVIPPS